MKVRNYAAIAAAFFLVTAAQAGGESTADEKPYMFTSQSRSITAQVEAIDHETREVTLLGPQGNSITFTVDEEARNLGQVEKGDIVMVDYVQNLSIEVYDSPGVAPTEGELAAMERAAEGEMPGMATFEAHVVSAVVEDINLEANTFKLKWPDESVEEYVARDPANLRKAAVGDMVVITQTAELAISVEKTD